MKFNVEQVPQEPTAETPAQEIYEAQRLKKAA